MKKVHLLAVLFLVAGFSTQETKGQAPQSFKYQSIARDADGKPIADSPISLRLSIRDLTANGTILYRETHLIATNAFGLFTLSVGGGAAVVGSFASIPWGTGAKFLEVEADLSGGSNYISMCTSQLLSVPYA